MLHPPAAPVGSLLLRRNREPPRSRDRGPGRRRGTGRGKRRSSLVRRRSGFTLLELLLVLLLAGTTWTAGHSAYHAYRRATVLRMARGAVVAFLSRARLAAVARREVLRLRITPRGDLTLRARGGETLDRLPLTTGELALDSARLAPRTLRFNSRGQAAPGSVYLYAGGRGVRVVCNFIGRLRVERFRL